ncbi:MAG TPA: signal peptidase II [Pirellulales bacterium]|jgi:signal peptidase II|nr:signal peptidase II [Pirellulales bacterium]
MKSVPKDRYLVFLAIVVAGCALDLWTKDWIFARLGYPCTEPEWIIPGIFGLETSLNYGALFGIGQGQAWFFATLSIAAGLAIPYILFVTGAARDAVLNAALASVMAGIFGNLYDRLGLWSQAGVDAPTAGAVRDWILFEYHGWVWPNFNIADSLLVCGAVALFWQALRTPASKPAGVATPAR